MVRELLERLKREASEDPATLIVRVCCSVDGARSAHDRAGWVYKFPAEERAKPCEARAIEGDPHRRCSERVFQVLPLEKTRIAVGPT